MDMKTARTPYRRPADAGTPAILSDEQIGQSIDGVQIRVPEGTTVMRAAALAGVSIPKLCATDMLEPFGSCRLCLVEIEGHRKLEPACATPIADGMVINTNTSLVAETRKSMLEMLLANHPLDCPICDKAGECELQDAVFKYGAVENEVFRVCV